MEYLVPALCGFFLFIHLFFQFKWWIGLSKVNKRQKKLTKTEAGVSVIVCAHDEEENLKELIPLLLAQDHPNFEVIIVDDRSNDGTYDYLLALKDSTPKLKMVRVDSSPNHVNGKKYGLTLGIKAASNDIVLLTDADCRPASDQWVAEMAKGFSSEKIQFVLGYSPYYNEKGLLNNFIQWETTTTGINYLGSAGVGGAFMGVGRNLAYRKSFFLDNKGFNAHLKVTGGDDDLYVNAHANSKNTIAIVSPQALVYSHPKKSFGAYWTQKLRHLSVGKRYNAGDKINLGLWSFSQIGFWVTLLILALSNTQPYWALGVFLGREVLTLGLLSYFHRLTGHRFSYWALPVIDLFYGVYLLLVGGRATFAKRVTWT
jgi:glycosyltransferase involved in cell wall biosynthesis